MADARTERQKVKEITDKLEEGLKELFESEKYKSYLSTMSKFHNYSFNNTLLITMQKPEATLVIMWEWESLFLNTFGKHSWHSAFFRKSIIPFADFYGIQYNIAQEWRDGCAKEEKTSAWTLL